jgi:hexokinase
MILGSGFNSAYIERVSNITKLTQIQKDNLEGCEQVAVDVECGAFGDNGCIDYVKTDIDKEIDNESLFPNSFSFEKMFSGNFLGDVVRRIFLKLTKKGLLFEGLVKSALLTKDSFKAAHAVQIDSATSEKEIRDALLKSIDYSADSISSDDCAIAKYICQLIANRGAVFSAILLSAIIDRMARDEVTVAFDGSLYKYHPRMKKMIEDYITVLAPGRKFNLILAEDGSGKGAGLVAAVASKQHKAAA